MPLTVIALESSGVTDTGYAGTVDFTLSSGGGEIIPTPGTLTAGVGVFTVTASRVANSVFGVTATDSFFTAINGTRSSIMVTAGAFSQFTVTASTYSTTAGTPFTVTAQATDAYSNYVTGTWSLAFSSGDPAVNFIPSTPVFTNALGQGIVTAILNTTGPQTITVNSSGHTGDAVVNVN